MSKSNWIILAVIVVVGSLIGIVTFQTYRYSQVSYAQTLFNQGDYVGVIDYLEPKTQGEYGTVDARVLRAEALYRLRRFDEAQQVLEPHLRFGDEDKRAVALSGWILLKQGSLLQAQDRFGRLEALGQTQDANAGLASVYLARSEGYKDKELADAQSYIADALANSPNMAEARLASAEMKLIESNVPGAVEEARKAVELEPYWSEPYLMLGRALLSAGNYVEAEEAFRKALTYGGSQDETNYYLAQSLYRQGRIRDAQTQLTEIINGGGEMKASALVDAAKISLARQENTTALRQMKEAWQLNPRPSVGMFLYSIYARLNRWDEADALLNEIIADRPFIPEALLERGHRLWNSGDYQRAYDSYQNAVEQDPDNLWAYYNLGCLALEAPQRFLAPEYFSAALQIDDAFFPAQINFAMSLLANERRGDARSVIDQLSNDHPAFAAILRVQALERFQAGDTQSAVLLLERTPVDEENQATLTLLRGEMLLRVFQFNDALQAFQTIIDKDPELLRARFGFAHAAYRLDMVDAAKSAYDYLDNRTDSLLPERKDELQNAKALLDLKSGDLAAARKIWEQLERSTEWGKRFAEVNFILPSADSPSIQDLDRLQEASNDPDALPEALYNLALFYQRSFRNEASVSSYVSLLEKYPQFLPALVNLADLYIDRRRYDDAAQMLNRAHRAAPERVDITNNQAAALLYASRTDEAAALLESAIEQDGQNVTLFYNRGAAALHKGDLQTAESYYRRLNSIAPSTGERHFLDGLIKMQKDDWSAAAESLGTARSTLPSNPYIAMNYGIALARLNRPNEAEAQLREAIALDARLAPAYRALGVLFGDRGLYSQSYKLLQMSSQLDSDQPGLQEAIQRVQGWIEQETG
ncbi:MAG: tetratricopeptide repeat protein [Candidatus Hinthialibacter antarcticus]|nr:tetratricopeptide repeat protein [Candidatus Hinthialibacter antarcticus]